MWSFIYNALLFAAAFIAIPFYGARTLLTGKYRKSLLPKLGMRLPETAIVREGSPRIWIHAVSVGEALTARALAADLKARYPRLRLFLSTTTMAGQRTVVEAVEAAGMRPKVKVIVGGAPASATWASEIGADGYSEDAIGAVALVRRLVGAGETAAV